MLPPHCNTVQIQHWTLGLFNCCFGVVAGRACPILAGNKANIVIAGTQTCLPIYLLSAGLWEERGRRGVRLGDNGKSNQLHFSSFSLSLLFCCKAAPGRLKLMMPGTCFPLLKKEYQWTFTSICHSSSLHHPSLSLSSPPLVFHSLTSLWYLIYAAVWPHSIDSAPW